MGRVIELFPPLSREMQSLLISLTAADWAKPTICSLWSVKDVAAHLLGGNLGRLWQHMASDSPPQSPLRTFDELVALIDEENSQWVQSAKRISPEILIDLLDLTDRRLYLHFKAWTEITQPGQRWAGLVKTNR